MPIQLPDRRAILVLGMHRSGTSAMAGTLVLLGAGQPATLMPPGKDNPKGYWESVALMGFHDQLLARVGSSWDDWGPIDPEEFSDRTGQEFRARIPGLVATEFGDAPLFVMKDPRVCRLLPMWREALDDQGIEACAVITVRNPHEVAQSLAKRDGFSERHGLLLWLRHVLDAELESRSMPRCLVRYEDLLTDWRRVVSDIADCTKVEWPRDPETEAGRIDAFLEGSLRHHDHPQLVDADDTLQVWVADAARALDQMASGDSGSIALVTLDRVRREFDQAWGIFEGAVHSQIRQMRQIDAAERRTITDEAGRRVIELRAALEDASRQRTDLEAETRELQDRLADASRQRTDLQAETRELQDRLADTMGVADRHWSRVVDLEQRHLASRQQVDRQAHELAALARRALDSEDRSQKALLRAQGKALKAARSNQKRRELAAKLSTSRADVLALDAELVALRQSRSWRITQPLRSTAGWVRGLVRRDQSTGKPGVRHG